MDNILLFLAVLALLKSVWTVSLWPGRWNSVLFGGICAAFVAFMHGSVLELGKPAVDRWISDYRALLNLSLWVVVDLLLTAVSGWAVMRHWFGCYLKKREKWVMYCPPVIVFPALLYLHISLFYQFSGLDFGWGSAWFAVSVFVVTTGGAWGIKKFVPETELRLELAVLLALLLFMGSVGCTVFHPSVGLMAVDSTTDWWQTLEVAGVLLALPVVGFVFRKWRQAKRKNSRYKF